MKVFLQLFKVGYVTVICLFYVCAVCLIVFALFELWHGVNPASVIPMTERFKAVLESIGLLTIAVVALELGQTILEEEVQRQGTSARPLGSVDFFRGSWW